jgi:hypothetical protein
MDGWMDGWSGKLGEVVTGDKDKARPGSCVVVVGGGVSGMGMVWRYPRVRMRQ